MVTSNKNLLSIKLVISIFLIQLERKRLRLQHNWVFFFCFLFFFVISEEDCLLSFIIRDEKQRREGEGEWYFMKCGNVTVTKS